MRRLLLTREIGGPRQPRPEGATRHQNAEKETHDSKRPNWPRPGEKGDIPFGFGALDPPPRNPYIRGGNPKTRGRSPNFQNTEKLHAFWYSWDLSFFLSFFDIFQPRAPLERPLTTHERGRRTPTATTRIAFRLAWCPSWCIFRRCERLWVGLFPLSHPLATSFKLPGEK